MFGIRKKKEKGRDWWFGRKVLKILVPSDLSVCSFMHCVEALEKDTGKKPTAIITGNIEYWEEVRKERNWSQSTRS